MEYGLWNIHGGFWPGNTPGSSPPEVLPRTMYNGVNEVEPATFQATAADVEAVNVFTPGSNSLPCQSTLPSHSNFTSIKDNITITGHVSVSLTGHQDNNCQNVVQNVSSLSHTIITEKGGVNNISSESSLPGLVDSEKTQSIDENGLTLLAKKGKLKLPNVNDEEWVEDNDNDIISIKTENDTRHGYLFEHSYKPPAFGILYSTPNGTGIGRDGGTSDETDDDDDENEVLTDQQSRPVNQMTRSTNVPSSQEVSPISFQRSGYECGECGLVAETRPSLKKHISVSHPAPNPDPQLTSALLKKITTTAQCPMSICRFRTSDRDEMESHIAHHVAGGFKITYKKKTSSVAPQRVRYEREEYRCQICSYSCTVEKAFYKHLKIHSIGRQISQVKISCVICGKDRSSEVDMNKHMKKHRDDRFFCCDICIFKTVQLKKLIQHRRMHTGEKPHLCPHCSYRSARRDNLRSHVRRVHKKDNLFCDTFSPRGLLITANTNSANAPETSTSNSMATRVLSQMDSQ